MKETSPKQPAATVSSVLLRASREESSKKAMAGKKVGTQCNRMTALCSWEHDLQNGYLGLGLVKNRSLVNRC